MRIMSLHKQQENSSGLFVCRVFKKNEAAEDISGLYANPPARCSSSRNSQLCLPRPRTDIFKTGVASLHGAFTTQ